MTIYSIHYQTRYMNPLRDFGQNFHPLIELVHLGNHHLNFFKCLAETLNTDALQSRKERVHKIARHEIEGFILGKHTQALHKTQIYNNRKF